MRAALGSLLLAHGLTLFGALPALAEESADAMRARMLFAEGRSFAAEGRYEEACARFENSLSLVYGVGTMFNLADCWEKVGRTGSALLMFRRAAATAEATDQHERARIATERARALDPQVSKMQIRVAAPPKIEIKRNDQVVRNEELGAPVPVDPGTYRVAATSPGKKSWSSEVEIQKAPGVVVVTVPPLEDDDRASETRPAPPPRNVQAERLPHTPVSGRRAETSSPGLKRLALVLGGVGGGALTAGAAFAFQYKASDDDARALCPKKQVCTAEDIQQHTEFVGDARRARTLSYVGFGVGAAALGSAVILYFTNRGASAAPIQPSALLEPNGAWSAGLRGNF